MSWGKKKGYMILEVLLAILILQISFLGLANLFITGTHLARETQISLQALEILRGEMERLQIQDLTSIRPIISKEITPSISFSLQVDDIDDDFDGENDYLLLLGEVFWQDQSMQERSYQFVMYRNCGAG